MNRSQHHSMLLRSDHGNRVEVEGVPQSVSLTRGGECEKLKQEWGKGAA